MQHSACLLFNLCLISITPSQAYLPQEHVQDVHDVKHHNVKHHDM